MIRCVLGQHSSRWSTAVNHRVRLFSSSIPLSFGGHSSSKVLLFRGKRDTALRQLCRGNQRWFSNTTPRNISVAIVGSGPSGCYTAKYLLAAFEKENEPRKQQKHQIDVFDRLPTPYGLVRYGVAPDHPEVKNVQNDFDTLFQDKGVRFLGNVAVGQDVSVQELRQRYDVVVLSYGCESDRKLSVPGEDLIGVLSAREFVAWYNGGCGVLKVCVCIYSTVVCDVFLLCTQRFTYYIRTGHPSYHHIGELVSKALGVTGEQTGIRDASVVVVGQGNVALDCARVLAKASPGLYDTDLAARALPVLGDGVSKVSIVGRRGHIQGAFTIKEVRELVKLEKEGHNASFIVRADELDMGATSSSQSELIGPQGRPKTRIDKLLRKAAASGMLLSNRVSEGLSYFSTTGFNIQNRTEHCRRESSFDFS